MSTERATRYVLTRLGESTTALFGFHLARPVAWGDGPDADGRTVSLVGAHILRQLPEGAAAVAGVLTALHDGYLPEGVAALGLAPEASAMDDEAVAGASDEILVDGERGTGKTVATAAALPLLAEQHVRAGYPLPLRTLWVHDSLASAEAKTVPSLTDPLWQGHWQIRDSGRTAVFVLAGVEYVVADFVGSADQTAAERLKAACHVVVIEEAVASLTESGGVDVRALEVANSSRRLPGRRRVSIVATNPGPPDHWCFQRFIAPGRPGSVRCRISAADRLTAEDVAALDASFTSPDLRARLAKGEWAELTLGPLVTPGFTDAHVALARLHPVRNVPLLVGHDGGHSPTSIIGARYQGSVLVYAALTSEHAGTRQHLQSLVLPWLRMHAPWALESTSAMTHFYDPSMATGEQSDIDADPVRVIRQLLGGPMHPGSVSWAGRIEPVTTLLMQFNPFTGRPTLQIDPVDGAMLIRACRGRWYYPSINGVVSRDLPKKPNHPWEDLGDAFCYFTGGIAPTKQRKPAGWRPAPSKAWFDPLAHARGSR